MKHPKITVLMSVYNGERYLREAIDSILNQTFKYFEFLIINDGSTDSTAEILQSYSDSRIKIINNERNIGLTKSLNMGLMMAKGEYIARMDADDISVKDRLKLQYDFLENNKDIGFVFSLADVIDVAGKRVGRFDKIFSPEEVYYILYFGNCIAHSTVFFSKDIVINSGGYDERMDKAQDYELWTRLSKITKLVQINKVLVSWRETKSNMSSTYLCQQTNPANRISKQKIEDIIGKKITNNEYSVLKDMKLDNVKINNFNIFKNILTLLDTFNKNLLSKESNLIKKIGLQEKKLKNIIKYKRDKYIYLYFRNNLFKKSITDFFLLPIKLKINLLKYILKVLTDKIVKTLKRSKYSLNK